MTRPVTLVERLASHLALQAGHADPADHVDEAASILALIKEPDAAMIGAGDARIWRRMIDAALVARWTAGAGLGVAPSPPPAGTDEEGDVPFDPAGALVEDRTSWVQVRRTD